MKFEAKQIPEGINTSPDHPLKDLITLLAGIGLFLLIAMLLLFALSDYLVRFIPVEAEQEWFTEQRLDFVRSETPNTTKTSAVEAYLGQLVAQLNSKQEAPLQYTIKLIDTDMPNAFITPGGHIFVTTELLRYVNSENALAMVIAHEMAHQVHRHPIRSMGRGIVIALALMMFTGVDGSEWVTEILTNSINLGLLAYSREQERQADDTGLQMLVSFYGHAGGSDYFFAQLQKLDKREHSALGQYLETHPAIHERIEFLREFDSEDQQQLQPLDPSVASLLDSITKPEPGKG